MLKSFWNKIEQTTDKIASTLKLPESKPLDTIKETITQPLTDTIKKSIDSITTATVNVDTAPLQNVLVGVNSSSSSSSFVPPAEMYREGVDMLPNVSLLRKYQEKFGEIHANNVTLANKAEAVDRKLPTIVKQCTASHDIWMKMDTEFSRLPEVNTHISNIRAQIDTIMTRIDELEGLLDAQVETYNSNQISKFKEKAQNDTQKYEQQKKRELASLEDELSVQKARHERDKYNKERARQMEEAREKTRQEEQAAREKRKKEEEYFRDQRRQEEEILRERRRLEREAQHAKQREEDQHQKLRNAYHSAFQQQMDDFKTLGPISNTPSSVTTASLEQITIDEGADLLDDFLGKEDKEDAGVVATNGEEVTEDRNEEKDEVVTKEEKATEAEDQTYTTTTTTTTTEVSTTEDELSQPSNVSQ